MNQTLDGNKNVFWHYYFNLKSRLPLLFLLGLTIFLISSPFVKAQSHKRNNFKSTNANARDTINVKELGAKGDGISNDYKALKKATEIVNDKGSGIILFPPGNYYLANYNDSLHPALDLKFKNCSNVTVIGRKATINLNGRFNRSSASKHRKGFSFSDKNQIIPFYFVQCKNVFISGIEIDGNVDKMTRDKGVVEKGQGLITVMGCDSVKIENVFLHHSPSDGIYIGAGGNKLSRRVTIIRVRSFNNARQGLSITGLRDAHIYKCNFSYTGITQGDYGFHRPTAGVDIEPHKLYDSIKTGNIYFEKDTFTNNLGGQFLCTQPKLTSNITINDCTFRGIDSFSRYQVILAADSVILENSELKLGRGNVFPTWKATPGSNVRIINCVIESSLNGILSSSSDDRDSVFIMNNTFKFIGSTMTTYFPYLQTKNLVFLSNQVYIPSSAIKIKRYTSLVQHAILSKGNKFYSDQISIKPKVAYDKTRQVAD